MDPSFTRGEYWLLETAVTVAIPMTLLVCPELDLAINKPGHGMDRLRLRAALESLSRRGLISFHRVTADGRTPATVAELGAALNETPLSANKLYYELTRDGGAQWELFAAPDWSLFNEHLTTYNNDESERHEIVGCNRERLQRYFDGMCYIGVQPRADTVHWTELSPWQATYWKDIPRGYKVEFDSGPAQRFEWKDMPANYYWLHQPRWYRWS